ncbi:MAG: DUF294 nucleotidyltransferase-like domain-containing protein [Nitrospirae bacterium]|nr:DUF294 nucleotidyltransferase-like domain-containing protein [Nitrospirota bacterium]
MEFYPKGFTILHQDGPPSEHLRVIKTGGVKVSIRSTDDEEVLIDYRSEGDNFGFLSVVSGDKSRTSVIAIEDTTCYLISRKTINELLDTNPAFAEFFLKSFLNKYIDKTFKEMHNKSLIFGGGDKLLFTTTVGELATKEITTAPHDITFKEAAEIMSKKEISSLVLIESDGAPVGIVTDRDFRDKVVSKGRNVDERISKIMSISLIKAEAHDYCFEALLKMIRYNIHHLLVVDEGRLMGIITNHDLMMLQGTSPISLAREIENQQTIDGLITVSKKTVKIIGLLLKEGAKASNITRIITEINDRMLKKILEITEKNLGRPPLNYCWIRFGSEGRKEQTFKTDQNNAILYADSDRNENEKLIKQYFLAFSSSVSDSLLKCGFPRYPANYMASNQQFCQPLTVWKKYFFDFMHESSTKTVSNSTIFFDFRPIYGDLKLSEALRNYIISTVCDQRIFLENIAKTIIKNRPPIGFFNQFVFDKLSRHKGKLDIELKGISPIVDILRLFAIEKGVKETSTIDRINELRNKHPLVEKYAEELEYAFEFVMLLKIRHQFEQIESGKDLDDFINPNDLNNFEKKTIKEVFYLISKIQSFIIKDMSA